MPKVGFFETKLIKFAARLMREEGRKDRSPVWGLEKYAITTDSENS